MKKNFPDYYRPDSKELEEASKDAIFVFDTNCLLDILRVSPEIADKVLKTVEAYKGRVFITHHTDFEYHKHLYEIPAQVLLAVEQAKQRLKFNDIESKFRDMFKSATGCEVPKDRVSNYVSELSRHSTL